MAVVRFTSHLSTFFPGLRQVTVEASTVAELVQSLDREYPGIASYLVEDHGGLRKHVNIFVDQMLIRDRKQLSDALTSGSEVHILQALSGG
ncbi:MAG: molybdenum cofactor biosynthesis protein MoaD [Chlorobi bacterium CHB2]|nr:molybdenum cofactor biosynthesis protein MoaD [Chlorobi bacterium CHB2]